MKKFEQINNYMNHNKTKPVHEKRIVDFLPVSKFLQHDKKSYDHKVLEKFFSSNGIALKNFYKEDLGGVTCPICGKKDWLVWRNDFMYYDILNKCLINVEDDEELEESPELEEIDLSVSVCAECGAWSTRSNLIE